jgi:hypothetical protein
MKLLTQTCERTRIEQVLGKAAYQCHYHGGYNITDKESWQVMNIGGHTVTLNATSPRLYDIITEYGKANNTRSQHRVTLAQPVTNLINFVGEEWWNAHCSKAYPEPTIELSVNGKTKSINGDYKPGMIKDFCMANREPWEVKRNKKTIIGGK